MYFNIIFGVYSGCYKGGIYVRKLSVGKLQAD